MSYQDQIDESRLLLARARTIAEELEHEASESAKHSAGYGSDNTLRYPWMLGHACHNAGRRIAELEAWVTAHGIRLPDEVITEALAATPPLVAVPPRDREAASHAERGRR